ncbi:MAG: TRAP transporter small permease [Candidatus Marinimicrobia bacterium]|nr:TRAP transporter small permease [Candidatus Neomarinimicrobiota bacterium]
MQRIIESIDLVLSRFLIGLMTLIVLAVTWQVFTRFIIQDPSSWTEELARFLLIWIGVLGASYALRTRAHLGIDLITQRVGEAGRRRIKFTVYSVVILFAFFVMVVGGIRLVNLTFSLNQISAAMGIRMGYIYTVLPISGSLMIIYSILFMISPDDSSYMPEGEE